MCFVAPSVNQLYFWNSHLAPLADLGGAGDKAHLSRNLQVAPARPPSGPLSRAHLCTPLPRECTPRDEDMIVDAQVATDLCVLPKTCLNSFGGLQPVYNLDELSAMHGGSWVDPPQVPPPPLVLSGHAASLNPY